MIQLDLFTTKEQDLILWYLAKYRKENGSLRKAIFCILSKLQHNEKEIESKTRALEKIGVQK